MLEYLDKLRMKPRHIRERIAFFVTAVFSLFIGGIWWSSWGISSATSVLHREEEISPIGAVVDIAGRAKDSTSELLGGLTDPTQYNASSSEMVAQVLNALQEEGNTLAPVEDVIDNAIYDDATSTVETTSTTTASVE